MDRIKYFFSDYFLILSMVTISTLVIFIDKVKYIFLKLLVSEVTLQNFLLTLCIFITFFIIIVLALIFLNLSRKVKPDILGRNNDGRN